MVGASHGGGTIIGGTTVLNHAHRGMSSITIAIRRDILEETVKI